MAEMLAVQADLAVPILSGSSTRAVTKAIARAADAGAPVVVCGCGTSEHAAQGIAALLDQALRAEGVRSGAVEARESFEAALDPRSGGVTIGVSHAGATAATVQALAAAGQAGATTVAITALRDGAVTAEVDHVIATPLEDRSWCHTVGYTSPLLVGAAIAADLRRRPGRCLRRRGPDGGPGAARGPGGRGGGSPHGRATADRDRQRDRCGDGPGARPQGGGGRAPPDRHAVARDLPPRPPARLRRRDRARPRRGRGHAAAERAARGATLLRAAARVGVRTAAIVTGEAHEVLGAAPTSAGASCCPPSLRSTDPWACSSTGRSPPST
jgi:D-arabinose 5-phosphate isomerase GutQ